MIIGCTYLSLYKNTEIRKGVNDFTGFKNRWELVTQRRVGTFYSIVSCCPGVLRSGKKSGATIAGDQVALKRAAP